MKLRSALHQPPAKELPRVQVMGRGKRSRVETVQSGKRTTRVETSPYQGGVRTRRQRKSEQSVACTSETSTDSCLITNYTVTNIEADGRCLFRSVAYGWCLRRGMDAPNKTAERKLADDLRSKVADEFIRRRDSVADYIDEDFDEYVERMRDVTKWGGEPELVMLCHVVRWPIYVYKRTEALNDRSPLKFYASYGDEYHGRPIQVLHRSDHYEVLEIAGR